MQRFPAVDPEQAQGKISELFGAVKQVLGGVPNTFRVMGNSESVLGGYLGLFSANNGGLLPFETRNQIALAVSEINKCPYCLSAFTAIGKGAGMKDHDLTTCRVASSDDPKVDAALKFAKSVVANRGSVSDEDVDMVRKAGYGDAEILEIVANVAQYTFINYVNLVSQTEVDFPLVTPGKM